MLLKIMGVLCALYMFFRGLKYDNFPTVVTSILLFYFSFL